LTLRPSGGEGLMTATSKAGGRMSDDCAGAATHDATSRDARLMYLRKRACCLFMRILVKKQLTAAVAAFDSVLRQSMCFRHRSRIAMNDLTLTEV